MTNDPENDPALPRAQERPRRTKMMLEVVTVTIAGLSLLVSIFAILSSIHSNDIAERALQYSQSSFQKINRPFVTIRPRKFGKDSTFYEFSIGPANTVTVKLDYELKNIGNVAAVKLRSFNQAAYGENAEVPGTVLPMSQIVLGPGDVYYTYSIMSMQYDNPLVIDTLVRAQVTESGLGLKAQFGVSYSSELDTTARFISVTADQYFKKEVISLRYETYKEDSIESRK